MKTMKVEEQGKRKRRGKSKNKKGTATKRENDMPISQWKSAVGDKSANIVRIVGNNLNRLRLFHFGNKKL